MTEYIEPICQTFDNYKLKWWLRRAGDAKRRRQLLNKLKRDLQNVNPSIRAVRRGLFQLCMKPYVVLERINLDIYYRNRVRTDASTEYSVSKKIFLDDVKQEYPSTSQDSLQSPKEQIGSDSVRLNANTAVGTALSDLTVSVSKNYSADIHQRSLSKEKVVDRSFSLQNNQLETHVSENAYESRFNENNDSSVSSSNDIVISRARTYSTEKVSNVSDEFEVASSSKKHTQIGDSDLLDEQVGGSLMQSRVPSLRIKLNLKSINQPKSKPLKINPEVMRKEVDIKYSDISSSEELLNNNEANLSLDKNVTATNNEISDYKMTPESVRVDGNNANERQMNWRKMEDHYAVNGRHMLQICKLKRKENRKQRRSKRSEKVRQKFRNYFGETALKSESEEEHVILTEEHWNIQKFVEDKYHSIKMLMVRKNTRKIREKSKPRAHKRKLSSDSARDDTENEIPTKSIAFTEYFPSNTCMNGNEDVSYALGVDNVHMSIKDLHILRQNIKKEIEKEEGAQNMEEEKRRELSSNENVGSTNEETRESETDMKSSTKESPFHNIQEKSDTDDIDRDVSQNIENFSLNNNDSVVSDVRSETINTSMKSEENSVHDEHTVGTLTDASISVNQSDTSDDNNDDNDCDDNNKDNNRRNGDNNDLEIQIKIKPKSKSRMSQKFLLQAPFSVLNSYFKNFNAPVKNPDFLSALFEANLESAYKKTTLRAAIENKEDTLIRLLEVNDENVPAIDTVPNTQEVGCFSYIAKDNSLQKKSPTQQQDVAISNKNTIAHNQTERNEYEQEKMQPQVEDNSPRQESFQTDTISKARDAIENNDKDERHGQSDEQETARIITTENFESTGSVRDVPDLETLPNIQNITRDETNSSAQQDVTILNKNTTAHNQEERNECVQSFEEKTQPSAEDNSLQQDNSRADATLKVKNAMENSDEEERLERIQSDEQERTQIITTDNSESTGSVRDLETLSNIQNITSDHNRITEDETKSLAQRQDVTVLNKNAMAHNQEEIRNERVQSSDQEKTQPPVEDNSLQEHFRADATLTAGNAAGGNYEEERHEQMQFDEQERMRIITANSESTGSLRDMSASESLSDVRNITPDCNRTTEDETNSPTQRQDVIVSNKNTLAHNQEERNEHVQSFEQEKTQPPIEDKSEPIRSTVKSYHWKKLLSKISLNSAKKSRTTFENSFESDTSACDLQEQFEGNNKEENAVKNNEEGQSDRAQSDKEVRCITIDSHFKPLAFTRETLKKHLPLNTDDRKKGNEQMQSVEQNTTCITIESSFESVASKRAEMPNSKEQSSLNTRITACDFDVKKNNFTIRVRSSAELTHQHSSTSPSLPHASNTACSGSGQVLPLSNTSVIQTAPHATTKNTSHDIEDVRQITEKIIMIICSNYLQCRSIYKLIGVRCLYRKHLQQMIWSVHQIKRGLLNLQKLWNREYSDIIGYINQYLSKNHYQVNKITNDELLTYSNFLEALPNVCEAPSRSCAPRSNVQQFSGNVPHRPFSMPVNPNNSQSSALPRTATWNVHQQQYGGHYFSYTQQSRQPPPYVSQQYPSNAPHHNSNIPNSSQQQFLRNTSYRAPDAHASESTNRQSSVKYHSGALPLPSDTSNVTPSGYGLANRGNTNAPFATDKRYYALASTVNTSQQSQIYYPLTIQANSACLPSNVSSSKQNAHNATHTANNIAVYHKTGAAPSVENSCANPQAPSQLTTPQYNTLNTAVLTSAPFNGQIYVGQTYLAQNVPSHYLHMPVYVGITANLPQQSSTNPISQQSYLQPSQQSVINLSVEQQPLQQNPFTNRPLQRNLPTANVQQQSLQQNLRANQSSQQNITNSTLQPQNLSINCTPQQNLAQSSLQQQNLRTNHSSQQKSPTANVQQSALQQTLRANPSSQQNITNSTPQPQKSPINCTPQQNSPAANPQQSMLQQILMQSNVSKTLPIDMSQNTTVDVIVLNTMPKNKQQIVPNNNAKTQNVDYVPVNKTLPINPQPNAPQGDSGASSMLQNSFIIAPKTFTLQQPISQDVSSNKSLRTSETVSSTKNTLSITLSNQINTFDFNIFTDLQKVLLHDQLKVYFDIMQWPVIPVKLKKFINEKMLLSNFSENLHNHVNTIINASQTTEVHILKERQQMPTDKTEISNAVRSNVNQNAECKSNPDKAIEVQEATKTNKMPSLEILDTENTRNTSNAAALNNNRKDDATLQTASNTADGNAKTCDVNDQNQDSETCNAEEPNSTEEQSDASHMTLEASVKRGSAIDSQDAHTRSKLMRLDEFLETEEVPIDCTVKQSTNIEKKQKLTPTEIRETRDGSNICNVVSLSDEILQRTSSFSERIDNEICDSCSRLLIDENEDSQLEPGNKEALVEEDTARNVRQNLRNALEMEEPVLRSQQSSLSEDEIDFVDKVVATSERNIGNVNKQLPLETEEAQHREILPHEILKASSTEEDAMQSIDTVKQYKYVKKKHMMVDTHSNVKAINELLRHVSEQKCYGKLRVSPCSSTKSNPVYADVKESGKIEKDANVSQNVKENVVTKEELDLEEDTDIVREDANAKRSVNVFQSIITEEIDLEEDVNIEEDANMRECVNVIRDIIIKEELNLEESIDEENTDAEEEKEANAKGNAIDVSIEDAELDKDADVQEGVNVHENADLEESVKEHVALDGYMSLDQDAFVTANIFSADIAELSSPNSDDSESTNLPNILNIQSIPLSLFENLSNIDTYFQDTVKVSNEEEKETLINTNDTSEMTEGDTENEMEDLPCWRCKNKSTVFCQDCLEASYCSVRCSQLHWRSHHYKVCKGRESKSVVYID